MKTKLYLLPLLFLLGYLVPQRAQAQITAVDAYAHAWVSSPCATPAMTELGVTGTTYGTWSSTDSLAVTFHFGDGSDTTFNIAPGMSGGGATIDSFWTGLVHFYTLAGTYTPMITILAPSGVTDTAYTTPFTLTNTCANLSGNLYVDANGNCSLDAGEDLISGMYVKAVNTGTGTVYYSSYSPSGAYALNLPLGTYTVTAGNWWGALVPACPAGAATLTLSTSGAVTQDFGFHCGTADPDMSVFAAAAGFRPGFVRNLNIFGFSDEFCDSSAATISLTLPALVSYASTWYGMAPTVSGSTLTWNVPNLAGISSFYSSVGIFTDPSAVIGDSVCLTVTITPVAGADPDMSNNTFDICVPITNSFDPNEKLVAPKGTGPLGFIPVGTELLTYQVNFQNTGNDTAYTVVIKDLLDMDVDPASVHILGSSHPMTANIVNGRELQFRFSNIMLPDSNTNEPASHGFVNYQVRLMPSIASDATINNTAHIYFDYNDAIVTNTTVNTLFTPTSVLQVSNGLEARVYPNPTSDQALITVNGQTLFTATLRDLTGRVVARQQGAGIMQLDTRALPAGVYQLSIQTQTQTAQTKLVVTR